MASLNYMMTTDANPHDDLCPDSIDSWCHYKWALARNEIPECHHLEITAEIGEQLRPLYECLPSPELLSRCVRMTIQNSNESFNAQIWRHASQSEASCLNTIQAAVGIIYGWDDHLGMELWTRCMASFTSLEAWE